jgi:hypothetical protein
MHDSTESTSNELLSVLSVLSITHHYFDLHKKHQRRGLVFENTAVLILDTSLRQSLQQRNMTMSATTALGNNKKSEMWRSKLGTNYEKEFMLQNEGSLMKKMNELRDLPENRICADCGTKGTIWASVNLGIFLCMTCGAHHRSLGTHISLPKGCTGTYWWGPDEIERMRSIGNARAAELYGEGPPAGFTNTDSMRWKEYLIDKYVHCKYAPRSASTRLEQRQEAPSSPLQFSSSQGFSPSRKAKKQLPKRTMPDIDLIHFDHSTIAGASHNSPKQPPSSMQGNKAGMSATGNDFFGQFGL